MRRIKQAQSSLEILIALGIFLIIVAAVATVVLGNQFLAQTAKQEHEALLLAQQQLEQAKAKTRYSFESILPSSSSQSIYLKELLVEDQGFETKKVRSRVSWNIAVLRQGLVELTTILTNWHNLEIDDGTGPGEDPSGEWDCPVSAGTIDLGPGNQGTGIAVKNNLVFLSGLAADDKKPDLFSIDATNIYAPTLLFSTSTGKGLNALTISDNFIYAAHNYTRNQIQVIDISNPASFSLNYQLSLNGSNLRALSIVAEQGYLYVGSEGGAGNEFQIFSLANPNSPSFVGSYNVGMSIWDISVFSNKAYLAVTGSSPELVVMDISNPSSPTPFTQFDCSSSCSSSNQGLSVFAPNAAYVFLGTNSNLVILDASSTPYQVKSQLSAGGTVNDVYVRNDLAFLATSDSNDEFQVVNIANLAAPQVFSSLNFPQMAASVAYRNNTVYTAVRSNDALRIITSPLFCSP